MKDSEQLALTVLGWDGSGNYVAFLVKLAGTMGVDLSALTQALLREQVLRSHGTTRHEILVEQRRRTCKMCGGTGELATSHKFDCYDCDGRGWIEA